MLKIFQEIQELWYWVHILIVSTLTLSFLKALGIYSGLSFYNILSWGFIIASADIIAHSIMKRT